VKKTVNQEKDQGKNTEHNLIENIQMDQEEILRSIDRESAYRILKNPMHTVITVILVAFSLFQLWTAIFGTLPAQLQRITHLGFVILLAYWLYPATAKGRKDQLPWWDILLGLAFLGAAAYFVVNYEGLMSRSGAFNQMDLIVGAIGIILVIEACRRVVGWPIVIIAVCFILYAYFGASMPGFLMHRGYSVTRIISHLFYTTEGIIGMPIGVSATYIFLFILFGSFLDKTGIGQFFIDVANALAGWAAGGPAKVAVLTSALQGTISGSSVSNTVSTGSFTIPLMKSLGYKPEFAAAVEASASTGGQLMPPIMGAAAFLIAEAVGVPYTKVAIAAAIPAVLYFTSIWIMVDLEAKKLNLRGLPREELPKLGPLMRERGHLLIPLVVIIALMMMNYTPTFAAMGGIISSIVAPYLRKSTRIPFAEILSALVNGARNIIGVACACAVAGIIVGVVTLTGLGLKVGEGLVGLAGNSMIIALFFTMITSLILGMGVPTTANYLITSTIAAPIVMRLGVEPLAAHLFAFYFGILADITPPVALAAYAGSAIAKSNPFWTGVTATRLVLSAFLIPYIMVLNPSLILINTNALQVVQIIFTSLVGLVGISACTSGYLMGRIKPWMRIVFLVGGVMLIDPSALTDLAGISLVGLAAFIQWKKQKSLKPAA
jgi:TRAP transporter 4TM/12TM fusion protein